jgi:hypothetical protein
MSKFIKNYKNDWSIKHPKLNISKDEIRNSVVNLSKEFGYGYISGTLTDWDFNGPTIKVKIDNLNTEEIYKDNFKKFAEKLKKIYENISGKQISHSISQITESYEDYNVKRFTYSVPIIILNFK